MSIEQPPAIYRYFDPAASSAPIAEKDIVQIKGDERRWVVLHIQQGWASLREEGWQGAETRPATSPHHAAERVTKLVRVQ